MRYRHRAVLLDVDAREVVLPFPGGGRDRVQPVTSFRSTWLTSSLRALKERGRLNEYLAHLPKRHHEVVLSTVVGVWLPVDVAIAHYEACDALRLHPSEIISIGRQAADQVHGTVLATFVRLARGAGVTPWTVLLRLHDLWSRIWLGGGVCVVRLGPKEARIEIEGWPCAGSSYCRTAMRGVLPAVAELFCAKSYAREEKPASPGTSTRHVLAWA
jgi:hypothetical protein